MSKHQAIIDNLKNSIALKNALLEDEAFLEKVSNLADQMILCFQNGGKVLFCGNGGSAADAQHLAAEFSGRYYFDRAPLFAEALHVNTSYLTAVANDYSFDHVYARMVQAMGQEGDLLIGLSTSGNSGNVVEAMKVANELKMTTIAFTGNGGGALKTLSDLLIEIPSTDTPRIQECHMLVGHTLCEIVEQKLFGK